MLGNWFDRAKDFWSRHKYKIMAGVSFAVAGYFAYRYLEGGG